MFILLIGNRNDMKKIRIDEQAVGCFFWLKARWLYYPVFLVLKRVLINIPFIEIYKSQDPIKTTKLQG